MATHSSILAWRILMDKRSLMGYCPKCHKETRLKRLSTHQILELTICQAKVNGATLVSTFLV